MDKETKQQFFLTGLLAAAAVILFLAVFVFVGFLQSEKIMQAAEQVQEYRRHYGLITDSFEDVFWKSVYEEARAYGEESGVYLEWIGKDLAVDYGKTELLQLAIDAAVDGILLEGDDSEQIRRLIEQAENQGIPVVTVFSDSYESKRSSFVGLSSYHLGREYGRQIIRVATRDMKEILILMDTRLQGSGQSIVFNGIKETLENEGNHLTLEVKTLAVSEDTAFSGEETIRQFLSRSVQGQVRPPDMIICLSEKNTMRTYQAIVDYNLVGQVGLLGYYVTDDILDGVERKVIQATIAVDTQKMGIKGIEALEEYLDTGHVNEYITIDVDVVTINNIEEYIQNGEEAEE